MPEEKSLPKPLTDLPAPEEDLPLPEKELSARGKLKNVLKFNPKWLVLGVIAFIILFITLAAVYILGVNEANKKIVCTQEVKQCADGSFVSRTGSACEFAACPGE